MDTIERNLRGKFYLDLMEAEVPPPTRKQRKKTDGRDPLASPGPNCFPSPVPETEASLPIFSALSFTSSLFVSSISLLSVAKRMRKRRQKTNSLMLSDTKRQKSNRKKGRFQLANVKGGRKLREAKQFFLKQETMQTHDSKV